MKISTEGGMWVRQLAFNDGDVHRGHYHSHDHVTLLAHGRLRVDVEGVQTDFTAPTIIVIGRMKRHDLTALAPNTVAYCVAPEADLTTWEIK
jgi:quercetin dioxygenase-like cupin family protein